MLALTLFLAFVLSFALPEWRERYLIAPLQSYCDWLVKTFSLEDSGWLPVAVILPLLLVINLFDEFFGGLFFFAVFAVVAWFVLDVQSVVAETEDESAASVFARINQGLFCGALWFVLVHPLVAVGYRLMVWMADNEELTGHDEWSSTLRSILQWMDWPATFVSALFVSLAGKIRHGLRQLMLFPLLGEDLDELNRVRVMRSGAAALGDEITDTSTLKAAARQLIIRGFLFSLLALWLIELAL